MTRAQVYIHEPIWPFSRLCALTTAHGVDRSLEIMDPGSATVRIARNDQAITADRLKYGNILVVTSDVARDWAGPVTLLQESYSTGEITIGALEQSAILNVRPTPLTEQWNSGASGAVFTSIMNRINGRGHTGLFTPDGVPAGPAITDLSIGGQSALEALGELFSRTGYEWWLDTAVRPSGITWTLNWGQKQGEDNADFVVIRDRHLSDLEYTLDVSKVRQAVTVVGGFGSLPNRTAVTRTTVGVQGVRDVGSGAIELADQALIDALDVPPALRSETVFLQPRTSDQTALSRLAQQALERPLSGAEKFSATVNVLFDWTRLGLGDYVTINTARLGLGAIDRKVRIIGMQPDEELGELDLVLEVPVR